MTYDLYKPLRNHLRKYDLLQSLGVIRAYAQYLQFDQPFPQDIEVHPDFLRASRPQKGVYEWELEVLARELILNSPEQAQGDLRKWKDFSSSVNKLKQVENNIAGYPLYRKLFQENILLELYRIAHRQFPWQRRPNSNAIIRYFKIFNHPEVEPLVIKQLGLTAAQLYTIGYLLTGFYLDKFGLELPIKLEVAGITEAHVDQFTKHFAAELDVLRTRMKEQQSYDQDFAYVMNALISTPLIWVTLRRKRTLIAPIPTYVIRRFTEGVYYEICNVDGFSAAFGTSFQQYVGEALTAAAKGSAIIVLGEQPYRVGKELKASVDWIAADNTAALFVECKAKRVRFGAKIGLKDTAILDEDLGKMAGFVVQAYKTFADAKVGLYPHWKPSDAPVYPVIVTLEDWYVFGDKIFPALDEQIRTAMEAARLDLTLLETHPYSVCCAEELEHMVQVMAQVDVNTVMRSKVDGERRRWTVGSMVHSEFPEQLKKVRKLFPEAEEQIGVR